MPFCNTYRLTWFLLSWMCIISSRLLQQSAAAAPYLGQGVSPHHRPLPPDLECGIAPLGPLVPVQPLVLNLDEGYLLTAAPSDLERGIAPLGPPAVLIITLHVILLTDYG